MALKIFLCFVIPGWNLFYGLSILGLAAYNGTPISFLDIILFRNHGSEMSVLLIVIIISSLFNVFVMLSLEYFEYLKRKPNSWINRIIPSFIRRKVQMDTNELPVSEIELQEMIEKYSNADEIFGESEEESLGGYSLLVENVFKWYGDYCALKSVNLGVRKGEIFGLLGKNGSSKTTLLKCICGLSGISRGKISINGTSVFENFSAEHSLGVCPQNNRLYENLTVWEHLKTYHLIRGTYSFANVTQCLNTYKFAPEDANKTVKELSGGMKRKLSVALAFIGSANLILLDEPTSSLDVATRRVIWSIIKQMQESHSIILTSHSMEETEHLCNRIGIIVEGKMATIGTKNALKDKYGKFYKVVITNYDEDNVERTNDFVRNTFGEENVRLLNQVGRTQTFEVSNSIPIYEIFGEINSHLDEYGIEDYSVSNTTLEQVFLNFSNVGVVKN